MNRKKSVLADRCSFIFFALYCLTYVLASILTENPAYLIFLFVPVLFLFALLMNLSIKHKKMKTSTLSKISAIAAVSAILMNGIQALGTSMYAGGMNPSAKEAEIKRYPSIVPAWLFAIIFSTGFANFVFAALLFEPSDFPDVLLYTVISVLFLISAQISSTFALLYSGEKRYAVKSWKSILIFTVGMILILGILGGPKLYSDMKSHIKQRRFQEHVDNIERTIRENKAH